MSDTEHRIDYSKFTSSLRRLEEQYYHLQYDVSGFPSWAVEAMRESVIQRFEVCLDVSWKILARNLEMELPGSDIPGTPRPVYRLAAANDLLGSELQSWMNYVDVRNLTSHDYNEEKADISLATVEPFLRDAVNLHERISGHTWLSSTP